MVSVDVWRFSDVVGVLPVLECGGSVVSDCCGVWQFWRF